MTKRQFGVDAWIEMFRTVGLDEASMEKWHSEFETRWPEEHRAFLVWLGLAEADVARIRSSARGPGHHP